MKAYYELSGYSYLTDGYWDWEILVSRVDTIEEILMYRAKSKAENTEYAGHRIRLIVDIDADPCEDMH